MKCNTFCIFAVDEENFICSTWDNMVADQPNNLSPAAFSKQYLKPNYMFCQVGGGDTYAAPLKARLTSSDATKRLPLRTGCPSVYGGTCQ